MMTKENWRKRPLAGRLAWALLFGDRSGLRKRLRWLERRSGEGDDFGPVEVYSEGLRTITRSVLEEN